MASEISLSDDVVFLKLSIISVLINLMGDQLKYIIIMVQIQMYYVSISTCGLVPRPITRSSMLQLREERA